MPKVPPINDPVGDLNGYPTQKPIRWEMNRQSPQAEGLQFWIPLTDPRSIFLHDTRDFANRLTGNYNRAEFRNGVDQNSWVATPEGWVIDLGAYDNGHHLEPISPGTGFWHNSYSERTYCVWFNMETGSGSGSEGGPISQGGTTNGMSIAYNADLNRFEAKFIADSSQVSVDWDTSLPTGLILMTWGIDNGDMELWVNGELKGTNTAGFSTIPNTGENPRIGFGAPPGTSMNGYILEARVYDYLLPPSIQKQMYYPQTRYDLFKQVAA